MGNRILKDTIIYGFSDFLFKLISFLTFPILAYALSVEEFGVMALLFTIAGLLNTFCNFGLNNAVQRYYWDSQTTKSEQPTLVSTGLILQLLITLILCILIVLLIYPIKGIIYQKYNISWNSLIFVIFALIPGNLLAYTTDVLRLHFTPSQFFILSLLKNTLNIGLTLYFVLVYNSGLDGYFGGALLASWLTVPPALWLIRKDLTLKLSIHFINELLKYGYPFIFVALASWIFSSMDRWMLGEISNTTEIGYFAIASKFASIPLFMSSAFSLAWSPIIIKLVKESREYRKEIGRIFTIWLYIMTLPTTIIILSSHELLIAFTPIEYHQAASTLIYLSVATLWQATTQVTAIGISLEKQTHYFAKITWVTAGVNLILNLLLIPHWGAMGAAQATMISQLLVTGLYLWLTQKLHPMELEWKSLLLIILLILTTLLFALNSQPNVKISNLEKLWELNANTILMKIGWVFIIIGIGWNMGILRLPKKPISTL